MKLLPCYQQYFEDRYQHVSARRPPDLGATYLYLGWGPNGLQKRTVNKTQIYFIGLHTLDARP